MAAQQPARLTLRIELHREPDGRWIADVPGLPGVTEGGDTRADAVARVTALACEVIGQRIRYGERAPISGLDFATDDEPARLTLRVRVAERDGVYEATVAIGAGYVDARWYGRHPEEARARALGYAIRQVGDDIASGSLAVGGIDIVDAEGA